MIEVKPEIDTKLDIVVKPRLNILYMVIYELAEQFGADLGCLDTIRKGILEKQYIKKIILRYYNKNNEIVGEIYFDIDWEKYEINATDAKGAEFKINCKKSTYSQISEMGEEIVKYVNKMRQDLDIVKIKSWYNTINYDPVENVSMEEIDKYLGLTSGKEDANYNLSLKFKQSFEIIFGKLDELRIGIRRK